MKTALSSPHNSSLNKVPHRDEPVRDCFFDNARFILIVLVVVAHFIEPLQSTVPMAKYLWRIINTLHMPCMIFISGYFAKGYINNKSGRLNVQRVFTYAILYIAAQAAMVVYAVFVSGSSPYDMSIFVPQTGLWYLQVLLLWHLVLPVVNRLEPKYAMTAAVVMGLLVGYDPQAGTFLSVSRAISHFPFFMAGYYFKKEHVQVFLEKRSKLCAAAALCVVFAVFYFLLPYGIGKLPGSKTNYWNLSFLDEINPFFWWGARLFSYTASVLLGFAFLSLVPRSRTVFTRFGARTLQVYIIHLFIYRAINDFGLWKHFNSTGGAIFLIGSGIFTAFFLSLKIFSYPFEGLQSIKIRSFLREESGR